MKTLNFKITGNSESHNGEALIVESKSVGVIEASEFFNFDNQFKTNSIGILYQDSGQSFEIFENYIDSGSDDYFYFAIER